MPAPHRPLIVFASGLLLGALLGFFLGRTAILSPVPFTVRSPAAPAPAVLPQPAMPVPAPAPTPDPAPSQTSEPASVTHVEVPPTLPAPEAAPVWQPPLGTDALIQEVGKLPGVVSVVWGEPREVYVVVRGAEIQALSQRVCQILAASGEESLTLRFQDMGQEDGAQPVIQACAP